MLRRNEILVGLAMAFGLVGLAFLVADCTGGKTRTVQAECYGKEYRAPWTEVRTDVEERREGGVVVQVPVVKTYYHHAVYILYVTDGERSREIDVKAAVYFRYRPGDVVRVRKRYGKYTGWKWGETVL